MKKIALILQKLSSSWVSCKSITSNLEKAYQIAFPQSEVKCFFLNEDSSSLDLIQLTQTLKNFNPEILSFIDHKPHPGSFLTALNEFCPDWRPELYFHAFGDFTLQVGKWLHTEDLLRKYPVHFFCASEKQTLLLKGLLSQGSADLVSTLPFPVDTADFFVETPTLVGRSNSADTRDIKFLYTGRISLQKNILLLVKCFGNYLHNINPHAQLWLAGPIDDLGYPYTGQVPPMGFQSSILMRAIEKYLPPKDHEKVVYHGILSGPQLRRIYNQADIYISLSTHNDEDFGMAPAEAASCGLPLVLSDWAGFSSFKNALGEDHCEMVPVQMTTKGPLPDEKKCLQKMFMSSTQQNLNQRTNVSQALQGYCSIESVAKKLSAQIDSLNEKNFHAFHYHLAQLAEAQCLYPLSPFASGTGYSQLYRKIYDCYF
ncbi:MAG: glycosyltransferase family 4 protein [Bdellovibrio sp.]